jgi:hypothetical protein
MSKKSPKKKVAAVVTVKLSIEELDKSGYHVFLNAKVNGKKCRFLLDTGASKTVVDKSWFEKHIGKDKLKTVKQETSGLHSVVHESYFGKIDELSFGKSSLKKFTAAAIDLNHVNGTYKKLNKQKIHGILGSELLLQLNAVIDYKSSLMTLSA